PSTPAGVYFIRSFFSLRRTKWPASEVWITSAFRMLAWSSCITRCRIRCDPVRCTSTLIPGWAASNSLATRSALDRASEVYQTTLPSFRAASTRASCAAAEPAQSGRQSRRARPATRRTSPIRFLSGGERLHQTGEVRLGGEPLEDLEEARGRVVRHGEAGVAAELRLQFLAPHREVRPAARVILPRLEDAAVGELHGDVADELPRVVDARIELVRHPGRHPQHRLVAHGLVGELGQRRT